MLIFSFVRQSASARRQKELPSYSADDVLTLVDGFHDDAVFVVESGREFVKQTNEERDFHGQDGMEIGIPLKAHRGRVETTKAVAQLPSTQIRQNAVDVIWRRDGGGDEEEGV